MEKPLKHQRKLGLIHEMPVKMHKTTFFFKKKKIKKVCAVTLPKIFRSVT